MFANSSLVCGGLQSTTELAELKIREGIDRLRRIDRQVYDPAGGKSHTRLKAAH
jgi:hypothetical protein